MPSSPLTAIAANLFRSALALACAMACTLAAASDHTSAERPAAKLTAKPDAHDEGAAEMVADKPRRLARGAADEPRDPMDVVRERLAEKLGAVKSPQAPGANVLRVTTRASTAETPSSRVAGGHDEPVRLGVPRPSRQPATRAAPPAVHGHAEAPGASTMAAAPAMAGAPHAVHWDYQGDGGPQAWGRLQPEFAKCANGSRQSPIDIRDGIKVQLDQVKFDYKSSGFRVIDNGHTVQVNVASGNSIEVMGRRYDLVQFHFHRPSEERVDGRQFEMVAHLVHKDLEGRLAVVAVLLDRGAAQPLIQTVWNNLPLEKGDEVAAQVPIDLNALLPVDRSYYTYMGSLTTPPCSEGVLWMVLKNPVPVSPQQVAIFSRLYPMNARPIQSASGRLIKESN